MEDEVTPRSSMVETPEICRKTQSASDDVEELQTVEIQKPSLTSPGNTQNLGLESREEFEQLGSSIQVRENDLNQCSIGGVVDATSSGIWKQTESPPVVSGVGGLAGSQVCGCLLLEVSLQLKKRAWVYCKYFPKSAYT